MPNFWPMDNPPNAKVNGNEALGVALLILLDTVEELGRIAPQMSVKIDVGPRGVGVGVNLHGGQGYEQLEDEYLCETKEATFWLRVAKSVRGFVDRVECPTCGGAGEDDPEWGPRTQCARCAGRGTIERPT